MAEQTAKQFVETSAAELVAAELCRLLSDNVRLRLRVNALEATVEAYKRETANERERHERARRH